MLKDNIQKVLNQISGGNNLNEEITLVGATKTVSADIINQAIKYGLKVVAENKVQEFREKTDLIVGAEQHFIGHLQTNKVKYLVGKVALIHSVDSLHLASAIDERAKKINVVQPILAEINIGGELSKSGFNPDNAFEAVKELCAFTNLKVMGIMAMLPKTENVEEISALCLKMRKIFDTLVEQGYNLKYLSMGMSHDYEIAIKNGSNMIRLGSSLFGERNYGVNA